MARRKTDSGPGQGTAPAFALGPKLDFTLTRADALAWFALRREWRGWRKILMILWFVLAGVVLASLPPRWIGPPGEPRYWLALTAAFVVQFLILTLALTAKRHLDASRLIPQPLPARFQDRGDHLSGTAPDGSPMLLRAEDIFQIIETPSHLFFSNAGPPLILPATAFRKPADKASLAQRWVSRVEAVDP